MGMFFVKKVENGGCFVKKVENGFFVKKRVDLSSMQGALCTVSVFFYILLIWGHTHPPPCLRAWGGKLKKPISPGLSG